MYMVCFKNISFKYFAREICDFVKIKGFYKLSLFFLFVIDYLLLNIYFVIKLSTNNLFKYYFFSSININTILGFILN